jgi:ABC-type bacteriocin/lantibiotic exporter with double-glycine peptidase domain
MHATFLIILISIIMIIVNHLLLVLLRLVLLLVFLVLLLVLVLPLRLLLLFKIGNQQRKEKKNENAAEYKRTLHYTSERLSTRNEKRWIQLHVKPMQHA